MLWANIDRQKGYLPCDVRDASIPTDAGVYAWYREGQRMYVGTTSALSNRIKRNHLRKGKCLTNSAFRRNVAEHLGLGSAADIKAGRRKFTTIEVVPINQCIAGCEVAWIECETESTAKDLEDKMKAEYLPPLTKR